MVVGRVNKNCVFFRKDAFFRPYLNCPGVTFAMFFASFRLVSLLNSTNYDSKNLLYFQHILDKLFDCYKQLGFNMSTFQKIIADWLS